MSELVVDHHPSLERHHAPKRRWTKKLVFGLLGVIIVVAAVFAVVHRGAPSTQPNSDVPRVVGKSIEVSPAFVTSAAIETVTATRGPLAPTIEVVGTAEFAPTRLAAVGARAPGIVRRVFHVEGDVVEKGDALAEVDAPGLAEAQADLLVARAKKRAARLDAEREEELLERRLTTAREEEQARAMLEQQQALASAARQRVEALGGSKSLGLSVLRAPVAGVVAERAIAPGQNVGPGFIAFRIGDLDELWVVLRVFERHLELVRAGDDVELRPVADTERVIRGKVAHVGSVLDDTTRTADVRVVIQNADQRLRPGQAMRASIHASGPARVTTSVPATAVTYIDGAPTVFVEEATRRFTARAVELGIDASDRMEVVRGIDPGEQVVSKGVLALKSELFR